MGLDVLRPLPTGLCSPQGHLPGYLHHTAHGPEQGPGLRPGHPDQPRRRGNLGGMCQGCLRKPRTHTHTHVACQRGGSLVPSHPPSEPSSPSLPLQLHPGQQHQPPEQVTCPPRQHWVSQGQAVTHSQREGAMCQGVKIPGGGIGVLVGGLGRAVIYPVG